HPGPRRLRVHQGFPRREVVPGREDLHDLRGHERDPALGDLAGRGPLLARSAAGPQAAVHALADEPPCRDPAHGGEHAEDRGDPAGRPLQPARRRLERASAVPEVDDRVHGDERAEDGEREDENAEDDDGPLEVIATKELTDVLADSPVSHGMDPPRPMPSSGYPGCKGAPGSKAATRAPSPTPRRSRRPETPIARTG